MVLENNVQKIRSEEEYRQTYQNSLDSNESYWAERLGQQIANAGADALWPRITTDIALSRKDND